MTVKFTNDAPGDWSVYVVSSDGREFRVGSMRKIASQWQVILRGVGAPLLVKHLSDARKYAGDMITVVPWEHCPSCKRTSPIEGSYACECGSVKELIK